MLAGLEAKQSESLSELITLRENLESSRLEGELLRQEQTEVTAALARVRKPPPHLILNPASQILYIFLPQSLVCALGSFPANILSISELEWFSEV